MGENKTIAEVNMERKRKYKTLNQQFSDFPIGTRVEVICACQDMTFFRDGIKGEVVRNDGDYLGIIVKFDNGETFNFEPSDLKILSKPKGVQEKIIKDELRKRLGMMRQWLNEDRITEPNKMVTTEELLVWFDIYTSEDQMTEMKLLKCGCNSMASHHNEHDGLRAGHPTCIVHDCCEVVEEPNLEGRKARCTYYGKNVYKSECDECRNVCQHEVPSKITLAFFKYQPDKEFDEFYCGCYGWD